MSPGGGLYGLLGSSTRKEEKCFVPQSGANCYLWMSHNNNIFSSGNILKLHSFPNVMEITKRMHIYETFKKHLLNTLNEAEDFYFIELIRNPAHQRGTLRKKENQNQNPISPV